MAGILGRKIGMTQLFTEDGERVPVTVIEAGPCRVTAVREYRARRLPRRPARSSTRPANGGWRSPARSSQEGRCPPSHAPAGRVRATIPTTSEPKIGDQVTVDPSKRASASRSAGARRQGLPGTIKRHRFHRGPVSHGSHNVRAPGSIGASATPSRVIKGSHAGPHGPRRVTQLGSR